MIEKKYMDLIQKLVEKTKKKEVIWTKTSRDDEFKVSLSSGSITIDHWNDHVSQPSVDFAIRNENGDSIGYISFFKEEDLESYTIIRNLNNLARESYYKVDETIDSFFKQLSDDSQVGKADENSSHDDSDDLPF